MHRLIRMDDVALFLGRTVLRGGKVGKEGKLVRSGIPFLDRKPT